MVLITRGLLVPTLSYLAMNKSSNQNIIAVFGQRVRMLRKARELSQETFADLAGLHRSYMGGVECGERNVSLVNIQKIADALEISVDKLFQGL